MTEAVLDIRNISVDYLTLSGRLKALRHVSFTVPRGKIVGLVGESGCGKSTLASVVIRLMADNARVSGDGVFFEGENLLALSPEKMRALRGSRITMIFQDPMAALNPVISIGTQMTDIQHREKTSIAQKRNKAVEMLTLVGIADPASRLDQFPHEFSGGMRQRICIAMALLSRPALILADEPTTALDVTLEAQIVHLLKELQRTMGCSIVCVSHHLGMIAEFCDQVVVMYAGEVVEQGDVRDIFHRPGHPYTRLLLACDPANIQETTRHLPTIDGEIPDLVNLPKGCIFENRCPQAMEICRRKAPPSVNLHNGHQAACHLLKTKAGR
ncbi:MAG: ABC transporter ATP-binding protein [Desulfobacterales bacterium]